MRRKSNCQRIHRESCQGWKRDEERGSKWAAEGSRKGSTEYVLTHACVTGQGSERFP